MTLTFSNTKKKTLRIHNDDLLNCAYNMFVHVMCLLLNGIIKSLTFFLNTK